MPPKPAPMTPLSRIMARFSARLGREVACWRKHRGLTQQQLGDLSGVGQARIAVIEAGHWSGQVRTIIRIASALSVRPRIQFVTPQEFDEWTKSR